MAGSVDCTVVIPVFNRGEALSGGIESLRAQSLGADRIEIIYVDDGSNDGRTPGMIDEVVAGNPNARVFHEPSSGSPGRPRNVGLANAIGEFVFFADHDDWFDPQALERLIAWARQHDSDVVIGKVVGHGRRIAIPRVFRENRAHLPPPEAMISLTPHKLFRRRFLLEHDIRFPEGRRRLEDHHFVTHAYLHARTISVYAERVCYHHNHPGDDGNFSQAAADPDVYINSNLEVIELIRRHTRGDPGLRDAMLVRPVRHELINKAGPRQLHQLTPETDARKHRAMRNAVVEAVPASVIDRLGAFPRAIAKALRDDDPVAVRRIDALSEELSLSAELVALEAGGRSWTLDYRLTVTHRGAPVTFHPAGGNDAWWLDEAVLPREYVDRPEHGEQLTAIDLEVLASSRRTGVQWHLPTTPAVSLRSAEQGGRFRRRFGATELRIAGSATIDLAGIGGGPIGFGIWDLVFRADALGVGLRSRLSVVDESALPHPLPRARLRRRAVSAIVTRHRTLAIEVRRVAPETVSG